MDQRNNIFISYRREDSADVTGRIYDRLSQHFGEEHVFADVDSIPLGKDFRDYIDKEVSKCKVLLAVIGRDWVKPRHQIDKQSRLMNPKDFVRIEIESALNRNIPVIPVLVHDVKMPSESDLPSALKKLAYRNGIPIRPNPDFHNDMNRLILGLEKNLQYLKKQEESSWKTAEVDNSISSYQDFLLEYPNSVHKSDALKAISELKAISLLHKIQDKKTANEEFIEQNVNADPEFESFNEAKKHNTISSYKQYLQNYPNTKFRVEAEKQIGFLISSKERKLIYMSGVRNNKIIYIGLAIGLIFLTILIISKPWLNKEHKAFDQAKSVNSVDSYNEFMTNFPNSSFLQTASDSIKSIKENVAYLQAFFAMNDSVWIRFKNDFPDGKFNQKADFYIDSLRQRIMFTIADSQLDYRAYLKMYPDGFFVEEANTWLEENISPPPSAPELIQIIEDEGDAAKEEGVEVPYAVVESVPIYPGCEAGKNQQRKSCTSIKIQEFVYANFNTAIAGDLGLTGRQRVVLVFKIDNKGKIIDVRARGPHKKLEQEATRVLALLPTMTPGKQRGTAVTVPYSLPFSFTVD